MPGPAPKPPARRQRRNQKAATLRIVKGAGKLANPPAAPKHWYKKTRDAWSTFWRSELAQIVEPDTDGPAIERLFSLYDERERAYRGYQKARLVVGSQGQLVLNPLARMMTALDAEIRQLEDRLGLTPKSRLQLGITFGEAAKSLDAINRALAGDHGEEEEELDEEDPRFEVG